MKNSNDTTGNRTRDFPDCHIQVHVEISRNVGTFLRLPAQITISHVRQLPVKLFPFLRSTKSLSAFYPLNFDDSEVKTPTSAEKRRVLNIW